MIGLIAIYALTVIGVLSSLFNPTVSLFVYVLFATLRPQAIWGFAGDFTGISQWVGVALLVGWAFNKFGGLQFGRSAASVWALILFTVWVAISSTQAVDATRAYNWTIELLKVTLPLLAGVTLLNSTKLVRWMLWVIVFAHGYIGYEMNNWYYLRGFNYIYESGFGGMDNNSFGLSLVTALGPAVALCLAARKWPERLLAFVCASLILHTIILTYSRGAMLGLIATVITAFVIFPKRPSSLAVVFVVALLTARLAGPQVIARFETTFAESENRDGSAQSRVDLWQACWNIALDNPIFGVGARNFPVVAENYGFTRGKEAHSTWMQTLAETGFPGLIALISFYLIVAVRLWPMARGSWKGPQRERAAMASGVLVSMVGFIICGQFVSMVGLETPYYVAMVGLGLLRNSEDAVPVSDPVAVAPPRYMELPAPVAHAQARSLPHVGTPSGRFFGKS